MYTTVCLVRLTGGRLLLQGRLFQCFLYLCYCFHNGCYYVRQKNTGNPTYMLKIASYPNTDLVDDDHKCELGQRCVDRYGYVRLHLLNIP